MKIRENQKKSITRDLYPMQISLKDFYEKVENREFQHHIKLVNEKNRKKEVFAILNVLGKGRTSFTFLSQLDKKYVALRMSYDDEDFTDKFDSVIQQMGDGYKQSFLDVLYPSMPVQRLYCGKQKKKNEILFHKTVYVSFWEKADVLLADKIDESFEKKYRWFREFLRGLSIIHSKNRAHFDIKLENLFLVNEHLKIGDFEFYWKVRDFIDSKEYLYCGSIGYIAPEMFYHREHITSKVDIFSAGVTFARLFTGKTYQKFRLYPKENLQIKEILKKCQIPGCFNSTHMAEIKDSLRHSFFYRRLVKDKIKEQDLDTREKYLYEILLEMMELEPANRTDIYELIDKLGIKDPTPLDRGHIVYMEPRKPSRHRGWWLLVWFLVMTAAGLFFYFIIYNQEKTPPLSPTGKIQLTIKSPMESREDPPREIDKNPTDEIIKPDLEKGENIIDKPEPVETEESPMADIPKPEITPEITPEEKEKLRNQVRYEAYLDMIKNLIKGQEYKEALDLIIRAREIEETNELNELEQTINQLLEKQVLDKYKEFYREAWRFYRQGNYEEAKRQIEIARKIKSTSQLETLDLQVKRKIKEREEEYQRGLAVIEENIENGEYQYAVELIDALKKIRSDDRLLQLENQVNQKLAMVDQQRQEQETEYINYLQTAQNYMDSGDFEKAEEEIKKARDIKNSSLLQRLEEKLKDLKGQTQQQYEKYSKWARIYYEKGQLDQAQYYLELAEDIYHSHDLVVLGKKIQEKAREQEYEKSRKKADDDAYYNAIGKGGIWELDEYIRNYPDGKHVREAKDRLNDMLKYIVPRVDDIQVIKKDEFIHRRSTRKKRISGIVWLDVVIDINGNVTKVQVIEGDNILKSAAIDAAKQEKYEPFLIGETPRSVRFRVKVVFGQPTENRF